jgi:protein-S-isoprenylcysteine O-methyltransferase Ste14
MTDDVNIKVLTAEIGGTLLGFGVTLFLAAGTIDWIAGWVFLILFFGFTVALTVWLLKHDPGLLKERMTMFRRDQKAWDKVFLPIALVGFMVWLVLMPLDAVRFGWSRVPGWLQAAGAIILLASFYLFFLTYRENPYLSPMVRIQRDRGQAVVSTGPYSYVRHPMYSGAILLIVGSALLLGSWFGLAVGLVIVVLIAIRAVLEERMLREELPGYDDYMARVRHRLIPHVW